MLLAEVMGCDAPDVDVTALAYDNRLVTPGTLFFCVPGFTRDGHDFADDAIARGAVALVVQRPLQRGVPEILVDDVRAAMAPAAAALAGDPTARLTTVGITGTNGKTTTAFLVRALLEAGGRSTGLLGTVTAIVGGEQHAVARTTPEAIDLQRTFADMLAAGDEAVVMEVSSHALALHRADAIHWSAAVFTNLTQDHLDFHADMEDYFLAKRRLFEAGPELAVIDVDDPYGARLAGELAGAIRIGLDAPDAQVRARVLAADAGGSRFAVDGLELQTALPGRFNVRNALAAVVVARELGVDDATIAAALPRAGRVPGRFEPVEEGQPFAVIVDYSHTPDSLENALRAAREIADGPRDRRLRRRWRPRSRQAPAHGRGGGRRRRRGDHHVRQPAQRGPGGDHRRRGRGRAAGREGGRPPRRDRARRRAGAAGRRRRGGRQGPRAGPGVRGRAQGALRRRHRRPRGAACTSGRLSRSRRPPAGGSWRPRRTPAARRAR